MTLFKKLSVSIFAALFAVGCAQEQSQDQSLGEELESDNFTRTVAVVHPTEGNDASGTVTFEETDDGVRVQGEFEGLEPGMHGFHIHEFGDCSADDATSAGGHYNPTNSDHGAPDDDERHMGDMGNLEANDDGSATIDYVDEEIELNSIAGRGVVIHGEEDDLQSQPSGDAGPRVGCGVVGIANADM